MAFITEADYSTAIKTEIKNIVTEGNSNVQGSAELAAQALIESYLNTRYNVATIFNATGSNRHPLIIMYMIDIALYHMHARINPRNIPDLRVKRHDDAIEWLKMVQAGKLTPKLPAVEDGVDGEPKSPSIYGSQPQFSSDW